MVSQQSLPAIVAWGVGGFVVLIVVGILVSRGMQSSLTRATHPLSPVAPIVAPQAPVVAAAPAPVVTQAPPPPAPRTGPLFSEVDAVLDDRRSNLTEAQKQAYWQSVSGTLVTWEGEVVDVVITSGGSIRLRCNPSTITSDVDVTLDGTQIGKLASINKSQRITIQGIMQRHDTSGYSISHGRVVGL